ncbi:hypothetical protein C8F01DRAFT_1129909 [Mycena amicta]|nr:hypothetical protein C8F01DRAFT_1129909 [Mycena amicta]
MASPDVQAAYVCGPMFIGTCIELLLEGVVLSQFVRYFTTSNRDPVPLRAYVGVLALLSTVGSILVFVLLWQRLFIHFGTVYYFSESDGHLVTTVSLLIAFVVMYVQGFYLHRLFHLSKRNWFLVLPIGCILFIAFLMVFLADMYGLIGGFAVESRIIMFYSIYFPTVFAGDVILTLSTAGYLLHFRNSVLPQTAGVLTTLIRITFQTAAPATCCILVNFIISLTFPQPPNVPFARSFASTGVNIILPKFWVISLLWTLNARADVRSKNRGDEWGSSGLYVSPGEPRSTGAKPGVGVSVVTEVTFNSMTHNEQAYSDYNPPIFAPQAPGRIWRRSTPIQPTTAQISSSRMARPSFIASNSTESSPAEPARGQIGRVALLGDRSGVNSNSSSGESEEQVHVQR